MEDLDDLPEQRKPILGQSLDSYSISELDRYLEALQSEIARVQLEKKRKFDVRHAAEQLFATKK